MSAEEAPPAEHAIRFPPIIRSNPGPDPHPEDPMDLIDDAGKHMAIPAEEAPPATMTDAPLDNLATRTQPAPNAGRVIIARPEPDGASLAATITSMLNTGFEEEAREAAARQGPRDFTRSLERNMQVTAQRFLDQHPNWEGVAPILLIHKNHPHYAVMETLRSYDDLFDDVEPRPPALTGWMLLMLYVKQRITQWN
jgi:hypothetical protein